MTYDWQIEAGDKVKVFPCDDQNVFYYGVVRSVPGQTGEAWIITDSSGDPTYQQTYNRIVRLQRGDSHE